MKLELIVLLEKRPHLPDSTFATFEATPHPLEKFLSRRESLAVTDMKIALVAFDQSQEFVGECEDFFALVTVIFFWSDWHFGVFFRVDTEINSAISEIENDTLLAHLRVILGW
jgi:hypothetical protein